MADSERPVISLVAPFFNEEAVINEFRSRILSVLESIGDSFEIICVNDGSRDKTAEMLDALCTADSRFKALHFSRNFGHQAAVTAGVQAARGQCAVIIDADLQDPPELITSMVAKWREGFDLVYAQRRERKGEKAIKRATAYLYYRALALLSDVKVPVDTGDFCLLDRKVIDVMNAMPERNRYLRGLRAWVGFRQVAVEFDRQQRHAGISKYPFRRMARLALDGIISLSNTPLRLAWWLGGISIVVGLLLAVMLLVEQIVSANQTSSAWIIVMILFLGGVQLLCTAVLGEYIGRIYDEVKQRPLYIVARTSGYD